METYLDNILKNSKKYCQKGKKIIKKERENKKEKNKKRKEEIM
jgi:hypothetical protein